MSGIDQTLPPTFVSWWRDSIGRLTAISIRLLGKLNSCVPPAFFNRSNQLVLDAMAAMAALFIAYQLRFDGAIPPKQRAVMWYWIAVIAVLRPFFLWIVGTYTRIWRYFDFSDGITVAFSSSPPTLIALTLRLLFGIPVPSSIILMELGLFLIFAFALRYLRRLTFELSHPFGLGRRKAALVGAGDTLAAALRQTSLSDDFEVVALFTPDVRLRGLRIGGFPVLDQPAALGEFLLRNQVDLVLISDARLDGIGIAVQTAAEFGAEVRLLPSASNVLHGDVRVSAVPDHNLASTGKSMFPTAPHAEVVEAFRNKSVLITGAGGSIGAEITRQVSEWAVARMILLDRDENATFEIHGELLACKSVNEIVPLVGDVRDRARLKQIFQQYHPDIVLHAAAYKHVPLMESNPTEAVLNNVLGTRELADAAIHFKTERFVMISTDKAVKPTSVMGATKRTAELLLQRSADGNHKHGTRFACVRFGNVVGSRGSVVPIFLRQIAAGGPVTITHEQMTRYFMTIPEAVSLVLQAATLASNGDIYMLDMGDPVKITDLADRLISMSGLRPGKDIEIKFVGLRPGEKLHEQLWYDGSLVHPTRFPGVLVVQARHASERFESSVQQLLEAALSRDDELVVQHLRMLPIDFQPGHRHDPESLDSSACEVAS